MERSFDDVTVLKGETGKKGTVRCHLDEFKPGSHTSSAAVSNRQLRITATVDGKLYAHTLNGVNSNTTVKTEENRKYIDVKVGKGEPPFNLGDKI